ncbi:signal peptidase I [Bifidobacterium favimelis]|uniref:Signal peptidase I n=1 Tax=Bifidobacterium favimelis TaxID=3122979 RepID=A0ABU8ZPU1_9BIFI
MVKGRHGRSGDSDPSGTALEVPPHAGAGAVRRKGPAHAAPAREDEGGGLKELAIDLVVLIAAFVLVRVFLLGLYVIPSGSMEDTLGIGDRVITTNGLTRKLVKPRRGDIVVFVDPAGWLSKEGSSGGPSIMKSDFLIKRLIGMPGDTVECAGSGAPVKVNGVALDETSYIRPGSDPSAFAFKVKVSEDHVFVLGDNRSNSADSRYHQGDGHNGLVPMENIKGTGLVTYWPLTHWKMLNNRHSAFDGVPAPGGSGAAYAGPAPSDAGEAASGTGAAGYGTGR